MISGVKNLSNFEPLLTRNMGKRNTEILLQYEGGNDAVFHMVEIVSPAPD
jgi:hypothetical protein